MATSKKSSISKRVAVVASIVFGVTAIAGGIAWLISWNANFGQPNGREVDMINLSVAMIFWQFLPLAFLVLYVALVALIADMAKRKGRSWAVFFWLALLFSPLIMWIIAASISPQAGSAAYVAPPQSGNPDSTEQLKKLAELRDEGILTKAEFESKKKDLLDRI
jgi:hypothetical protein